MTFFKMYDIIYIENKKRKELKIMSITNGVREYKYFVCPHCGKQLLNENLFRKCDNVNEYFCEDCGKTYIRENETDYIEEDAQ